MFSRVCARLIRPFAVMVVLASLSIAGCSRQSADSHFRRGNEYFDSSQLQAAVVEYRSALQIDSKRGDIRLKLAETFVKLRDGGNALREFVRAADLLPNDADAQMKAGSFLLFAQQFEDAKTRAQKALEIDPKNANAQILMGNALAGLKNLDGAIAEYQEALALDPNQDGAYVNIGAVQVAKGQHLQAEASFKKAIEVAPKSINAHLALANFYWSSNRIADAEQSFKNALAVDPANLSANQALGTFYLASGRANEAEQFYQAIAKNAKETAGTLALADYYIIVRKFDEARKILRGLATRDESYVAASTRLAALDVAEGHRAQALELLRQVQEKYPKEQSSRLLTARLLLMDGKRDEALAEANTVVKDLPTSMAAAQAYTLIGRIQAMMDHPDEAIKAYQEVLKIHPRPLEADVALAGLHLLTRSFDKAETYAQQALAIQPRNPDARVMLVRILLAKNDVSKAKDELAALQKEFPNAPPILNLVGAEQLASRQVEAARVSYTKAAQLAPKDLEALGGLVQVDLITGHAKDAVTRVEAALKTMEPSGTLYTMAAQVYGAVRDAAKAEEMLKRAINLEPARIQAYGMLGSLYMSQKRVDDAKDQFQRVLERNPKSVASATMMGMLLEAQNKVTEAEQQYQKVLAMDPTAAVAANNLAAIYSYSNRNLDEALQLAQTAQQGLPDEPHVTDTLGWIYYQKNMSSQAIRFLESSTQKDQSDPTTFYHLGMAYLQAGDREKAKKTLQRALAFNRGFLGIEDAKKALAQIGG